MNLPSISEISEKAQNAFKRFPVTLIWAITGTFFFIWLIEGSSDRFDTNIDILLTLVIGISWLIGVQFYVEQLKAPKKWFWLKAAMLGLLFAFFWYLPGDGKLIEDNPEFIIRFALYFIAGHLFVLFAPFILRWDKAAYWNYLKSMGIAISRSVFFSGVLYLGLVLALAAVNALFDVQIRGERYGQLFVFCLGIVNTWIYLSDFPRNIIENRKIEFNKALEVLVKYILIPLVMLYIVILYAYGLKILIEWELPKGWVSYLVTALALLGFTVQVIINPVQRQLKSWTINNFYPWFYYLLLPLVILLFVAIFRRIADYGITENRYFVIVLAFWILAMALYQLFAKKRRLILLPISLFVLAATTSFGPWGAISVSKKSQIEQFKAVFTAAKANGGLANYKEYEQLKSIISYLDERQSMSKLDPITGIAMEPAFKDSTEGTYQYHGWLDTDKVMDSIGIKIDPNDISKPEYALGKYYNYYGDQNKLSYYDLNGYDHLAVFNLNQYAGGQKEVGDFLISYDSAKIDIELLAKKDSVTVLRIPLEEKLLAWSQNGQNLDHLKEEDMTLYAKNDSIGLKLIFKNLGYTFENDSLYVNHSDIFLFLERK